MTDRALLGVRFGPAGRVAFYATTDQRVGIGEHVVVPTERGPAVARVVIAPHQILSQELPGKPEPIVRRATSEDLGPVAGPQSGWPAEENDTPER